MDRKDLVILGKMLELNLRQNLDSIFGGLFIVDSCLEAQTCFVMVCVLFLFSQAFFVS